jgi:LPXTG-site transpeptidase (sortase) family protein
MTLYTYKKAPPKEARKTEPEKEIESTAITIDNIINSLTEKLYAIRPMALIIPFVFVFSGISILTGQIKPYAIHFLQSKFSDKLNQEIIALVPESYEEIRSSYISDPGSAYFTKLLSSKGPDENTLDYEGTFYLTIDKIQINKAPVTANVDSTKEEKYREALGNGLAHFKGTNLPGGDGNTFIYGHSAAGDYAERNPQDVVTAFTRLFKLNIGDKIYIDFEDKTYEYTIKKIKEINPEDVKILTSNNTKTLTLMTCSPPGLSSKRLVITAVQSNVS